MMFKFQVNESSLLIYKFIIILYECFIKVLQTVRFFLLLQRYLHLLSKFWEYIVSHTVIINKKSCYMIINFDLNL